MTDATIPEVVFSRDGIVGRIELNRPRAMNALTYGMVTAMAAQLDSWATDNSVETVLLTGAGERGLCAGGDIVSLYREVTGGSDGARTFWTDEYRMNAQIANYPKPFVAIMDGVTLGGGVGVSAHGSVRVVTERTRIGMPEVGIGFVPDVGGTFLLSRAPGELGTHAGLTGGSFSGADGILLGLADHFVPSERLPELIEALADMAPLDAIHRFSDTPPASALAEAHSWIDECYNSNDATAIVARLAASGSEDARATAEIIRSKSPTAVTVTLEALRRARALPDLEAVLDQELRVSLHCAAGAEMIEGIRAQVIDKDRTPHWSPTTLGEVDHDSVAAYFAPLPADHELGLSPSTTP